MADPIIPTATLTADGADNEAFYNILNHDWVVIHVIYTKGTEQHGHIQCAFSTIDDDNGTEIWSDWSDINQVGGADPHLIENFPFKITETGNYRLPPTRIAPHEDRMRIRVWAENPGATPGTMQVFIGAIKP
jgi:hypothetical protein